jgi:hypothetical protein
MGQRYSLIHDLKRNIALAFVTLPTGYLAGMTGYAPF